MQNIITQALKLGLWHTLDVQFAKMLSQSISSENKQYKKNALILASASLSACIHYGHTCLPLNMLDPDILFQGNYPELAYEAYKKSGKLSTENWQELLFSLSAVSNGSYISPLILENKYLYLYRMWKEECIIAKFFNSKNNPYLYQRKKISDILNQLFPAISTNIDWAKIAVAISLIKQKVLISGGPGTGKTFIIAKIIAAFLLLHCNKLNIKMIAPTGKAAAHLTESFNLTIHNFIQLNKKNENILSEKATTIHNLLGARLYKKNITQDNYLLKNPLLSLDLLIIDEASMISSSILAKLILALPKYTRIIFLGDHHQLCSVAPGSVFKDICSNINSNYSPEHCKILMELTGYILPVSNKFKLLQQYNNYRHIIDSTCILKKNYRFNINSGINQLSIAINLGDSNRVLSILMSHQYIDLYYIRIMKNKDYIKMVTHCAEKYYHYLQTLKQCNAMSIINILKIFNQYQILCALNDGPFGTIKINYYIEQILHQKGLIKLNKFEKNYIGRPIIILRNELSLGLSNGDTGILLLNSKNKLSAFFLCPKKIIKIIPIYQLPKYETCFAITIHKSQGSEFQNITIILPNQYTPILTKELLYTAVTRARKNLVLYATDQVITYSVNLNLQRHSGLYNKISNIYN